MILVGLLVSSTCATTGLSRPPSSVPGALVLFVRKPLGEGATTMRVLILAACALAVARAAVPVTSVLDGGALGAAPPTPTSSRTDNRILALTEAAGSGRPKPVNVILPPGLTARIMIGDATPLSAAQKLAFAAAVASSVGLDASHVSVTGSKITTFRSLVAQLVVVRISFASCDAGGTVQAVESLPSLLDSAVAQGALYEQLRANSVTTPWVELDGEPIVRSCRPMIHLFEPAADLQDAPNIKCVYTGHHVRVHHTGHKLDHAFFCHHFTHEPSGQHRCGCKTWRGNVKQPVPGAVLPSTAAPLVPQTTLKPKKIDCRMTQWSAWTVCSASCGSGKQLRYRVVKLRPTQDGDPCPPDEQQVQSCKLQSCATTPPPKVCCKAMTPPCLACAAGMTVKAYCAQHPGEYGCPSSTSAASMKSKTSGSEYEWWNLDKKPLSGETANSEAGQFPIVKPTTNSLTTTTKASTTTIKASTTTTTSTSTTTTKAVPTTVVRTTTTTQAPATSTTTTPLTTTTTTSTTQFRGYELLKNEELKPVVYTTTTARPATASCPAKCRLFFDGCNTCSCSPFDVRYKTNRALACTRKYCATLRPSQCLQYAKPPVSPTETTTVQQTTTTTKATTTTTVKQPTVCCTAMTPTCLACAAGVSVDEYCAKFPGKFGCPSSPKPTTTTTLGNPVCPATCRQWFDGCNTCSCQGVGQVGLCTRRYCISQGQPKCADYNCLTREVWTMEKAAWCALQSTTTARPAPERTRVCTCPKATPCRHDGGVTCVAVDAVSGRCPALTTRCRCECCGATPCSSMLGSCHPKERFSLDNKLVCPKGTTECSGACPATSTVAPKPKPKPRPQVCRCGIGAPCQRIGGLTCFPPDSRHNACPPQTMKCNCPCTGSTPCSVLDGAGKHLKCAGTTDLNGMQVCSAGSIRCMAS